MQAIQSNPKVKASTQFLIPKFEPSNRVFNGSLRVIPGCFTSIEEQRIRCSQVEFQSFSVINQFFENLQHLSLISSDQDSFADFRLFGMPSSERVSPVASARAFAAARLASREIDSTPENQEQTVFQSHTFSMTNTFNSDSLAFSFEVAFDGWRSATELSALFPSVTRDLRAVLLEVKRANDSVIDLSLVGQPPSADETADATGTSPQEATRDLGRLEVRVNGKILQMSKPVILRSRPEPTTQKENQKTSVQLEQPLQKNFKFSVLLHRVHNRGLVAHLFLTNTASVTGANLTSTYSFAQSPESKVSWSGADIHVLTPSVNQLDRFFLDRFVISDSMGALIRSKIKTKASALSAKCNSDCLLGGFYMDMSQFESKRKALALDTKLSREVCWTCKANLVFQSRTGTCAETCRRSTRNRLGNCVPCRLGDCSDAPDRLTYKLDLGEEASPRTLKLTPSIAHFNFGSHIYEKNFEIFESADNGPFVQKNFTVEIDETSQAGTFTLTGSAQSTNFQTTRPRWPSRADCRAPRGECPPDTECN